MRELLITMQCVLGLLVGSLWVGLGRKFSDDEIRVPCEVFPFSAHLRSLPECEEGSIDIAGNPPC